MTISHFLIAAAASALFASTVQAQPIDPPIDPRVQARIDRILKRTPLIDGHNDLPEQLTEHYGRKVDKLASGTARWQPQALMTDMARLREGRVGGQFWSVYIDRSDGDRSDGRLGGKRKAQQAVGHGHQRRRARADMADNLGMIRVEPAGQ